MRSRHHHHARTSFHNRHILLDDPHRFGRHCVGMVDQSLLKPVGARKRHAREQSGVETECDRGDTSEADVGADASTALVEEDFCHAGQRQWRALLEKSHEATG